MGSNSFGRIFRITTWGESHGPSLGVVIDGCPAGVQISETVIQEALSRRAPGRNPYVTSRKEPDRLEILSGVFEGLSTGAPIAIEIKNYDHDSSSYEEIRPFFRPGHANFTYLEKYGLCDERGGGRASARETVLRVAAGAIATQILAQENIAILSYIKQIGPYQAKGGEYSSAELKDLVHQSPFFCPDLTLQNTLETYITNLKEEGDSCGGIVETQVTSLPPGLGDPVYDKLEAWLAYAMLSLPASKGFEIGSGFQAAAMKGSEHNDLFISAQGKVRTSTNHAGGTLGGISTGMPLVFRVVFKPPSSIKKPMQTLTKEGEIATFQLPANARHDPCVAIRAVPVVEAMCALVLVDAWLMQRVARL